MKPDEIAKLTKFLRTKFELPSLSVRKRPQKNDSAEVYIGDEFIGVKWFGDVVIHACEIPLSAIRRHSFGGQKNHWRSSQTLVFAELAKQAIAIEARHHHVANDDIGQHLLGFAESFFPVLGRCDIKPFIL